MIRSAIKKGLQRRGNSPVDSSILIEQTGDMEITVRAGSLTTPEGKSLTLASDTPITLTSDDTWPTLVYVYLTLDGKVDYRTATPPDFNEPVAFPPIDNKVRLLIGWGWLVIPAGATTLPDFHTFSWIDNLPMRRKPDGSLKLVGKGEDSGKEFEFDEIEHFAQRKGQGGVFFHCPQCGATTRGRPCRNCGNTDTVKIKDCD